jgi:hypothetical protein
MGLDRKTDTALEVHYWATRAKPMMAIAAMTDKLMNSRTVGGGILLRSLCV